MSNDFNDLKAAMGAETPKPDVRKRAQNIALAQKNFDDLQGSANEPRPTSDRRPFGWLISGVANMYNTLTTRGAMAATTAIVAFGVIIITPQGRQLFTPTSTPSLGVEQTQQQNKSQNPEQGLAGALVNVDPARGRNLTETTPPPVAVESMETATPIIEFSPQAADKNTVLSDMNRKQIMPAPMPLDDYYEAPVYGGPQNTEEFANEPASQLKITHQDPVSTFSIDVDTASYGVVRSSLMAGNLPPSEAVRIEEMINYFPYDYTAPEAGDPPFSTSVSVLNTPWNPDTQLVHIALQGRMPAVADRPPLNLVFLIDTSGSMQDLDKLPLLKQSFKLMLGQLRPEDQVSIVTYAGSAGQVLEPTSASERSTILTALDRLEAGGSTAGQEGLQQAYTVAESMAKEDEITRVILATDGDFNVGIYDPDTLKEFIAGKRDSGTYLSVLGFGRGNLDDATMQALAQNGNGTAAYIDTLSEAQKVLVDQLTGALFPIAGDVKVQVEFNPAQVAEYRLIGYETRALAREDFNNDQVDAGDIGAGHSVTAIYEITPVGSAAVLNEPLRYQTSGDEIATSDELGFLRLRYKDVGKSTSKLIETPINMRSSSASDEVRFGVAIAGFGQLLRGTNYLGDWSWDEAINLANTALGEDTFGYRREAVNLMRLAKSLSQ